MFFHFIFGNQSSGEDHSGRGFAAQVHRLDERTCIIVVEIEAPMGTILVGIVVDSVSEVLNIEGNDIEDTPTFGTRGYMALDSQMP